MSIYTVVMNPDITGTEKDNFIIGTLMELDLSIRALYTLHRMGVYTVEQLKELDLNTVPSKRVAAELAAIDY